MKDIIDKEFEKMMNEVCGSKVKRTRPTRDFYDMPMQQKYFMDWYYKKQEDKYSSKLTVKCDDCGTTYTIYTEPMESQYNVARCPDNYDSLWEQCQKVQQHRFYCWKCGKPFYVTGSKVKKIESNQLEVVL